MRSAVFLNCWVAHGRCSKCRQGRQAPGAARAANACRLSVEPPCQDPLHLLRCWPHASNAERQKHTHWPAAPPRSALPQRPTWQPAATHSGSHFPRACRWWRGCAARAVCSWMRGTTWGAPPSMWRRPWGGTRWWWSSGPGGRPWTCRTCTAGRVGAGAAAAGGGGWGLLPGPLLFRSVVKLRAWKAAACGCLAPPCTGLAVPQGYLGIASSPTAPAPPRCPPRAPQPCTTPPATVMLRWPAS